VTAEGARIEAQKAPNRVGTLGVCLFDLELAYHMMQFFIAKFNNFPMTPVEKISILPPLAFFFKQAIQIKFRGRLMLITRNYKLK